MNDEVFGELQWLPENPCWQGAIDFLGKRYPLHIELDVMEPDKEEVRDAVLAAKDVFPQLTEEWEQQARRAAAQEITEAIYSQSDGEPTADDVHELVADMTLQSLDFIYICDEEHAHPYLSYKSPKCFPDMRINIQFTYDLTIEEVTVDE